MNQERIFQILISPHISEKSAVLGDNANQAVFQVATDAKKPEIKAAVEQLFEVKVANVRTVNVKGKTKQMQARLQELGVDDVLVLTDGLDSAVYLAARNLPNVQVMDIAIVDPVSLLRQEKVLIDEAALKRLEERLS